MSGSLILTPVDGARDDWFGHSVSLSADGLTAIVGGYRDDVGVNADQGSARVFVWNGSAWVQRGGALTPTDGAPGDHFGISVSLSADGLTAIIGGGSDTIGVNIGQGSARVFDWDGTAWTQRGGVLTPTDGAAGDGFGTSVSLSADGLTAIVGGGRDTVGANANQGSARVFDWSGTAWTERGGALTPTDGAADDRFGSPVSLSADGLTAILGGNQDDVGGNVDQGSACVFDWTGTTWTQRGRALTPTDGAAQENFGSSVSLSADGRTAIVGGFRDNVGANFNQGSARVFDWNGTVWTQRGGALTPTDGAAYDNFGRSVSLSADGLTAIVGGYGDDVGANAAQGSARVFDWHGTAWTQRGGALTPTDGALTDYFGRSVSLSADGLTAIVGGYGDDVNGKLEQGSARVFAWNGTIWVEGAPFLQSVSIAATSASKTEGSMGTTSYTFTATRTGDASSAQTVAWAVSGSGPNAAATADFVGGVLPTGTVWFGGGETSKTITIEVAGDTSVETDEGFTVTLSTPSPGLVLGTSTATGTIANDDASVSIAATSASKAEGQSGTTGYTFTATRSGDTSTAQTAAWAVTGSGTNAASAADFVGSTLPTGTVSFAIGETSRTITIDVAGDTSGETDEGFTVTLSTPSTGIVIGTGAATGTIINDDALIGTPNADTLTGLAGNDTLNGLGGNDVIDGGAGTDLALFSGSQSAYRFALDGAVLIVSGPDGTDRLSSVETLSFGGAAPVLVSELQSLEPLVTVQTGGVSTKILPDRYVGPVDWLEYQTLGTPNGDVVIGGSRNDFFNLLGGDDAANGGAGDDVLDGGTGSNFLTGGAGRDDFFLDGRGGTTTWATITDWEVGERLSVFGWLPGVSQASWVDSAGAEGWMGVTMHGDLNGNGVIDTSVTWTGRTRDQLPAPLQFDGLLWFT